MRAPRPRKLLRRIAAGDGGRGGGSRRTGLLSRRTNGTLVAVAGRVAEDSGGSVAVATAEAPAVPSDSRHPSGVTTAAEDTYRYQPVRRPRWRWVLGTAGLVVVLLAAGALWYATRTSGAMAGAAPSASTVEHVPTDGMGVQACAVQPAERQSPVPDGGPGRPGEFDLLDGWTYHRDPSGFRVAVPQAWRMSRIGSLMCFRDPSSPRAIAVRELGQMPGDPAALLVDGERAWRDEAGLTDYRRLSIAGVPYGDGAADLEYTYRTIGLVLHGTNRMLRIHGRLFTLFWLTTDFSWSSDRALLDLLQASFDVS
jgi:hypothetical protein